MSADPQLASSRETGGRAPAAEHHRPGDPDGGATTGTDENEEFVGRVAGQDAGYSGETGAEARRQGSGGGGAMGRGTSRGKDGNELTGLAKLAYKPFGLAFGMLGGLLAGKVFGMIWKRISHEDETPQPLSDEYTTREVLIAATLQGAVFGLIKTAVDRYGMKGVRRFLDTPRPTSRRRVASVT